MGILVIILVAFVIVIIIGRGDSKKQSGKTERDYQDDEILRKYLDNSSDTSFRRPFYSSKKEAMPIKSNQVDICKYHESNQVIGKITIEYWRKYHESEGPYSYIHPSETDDFIMKYVINIWNDILDKEATIKDDTLDGVISRAESQFKIWADKVKKKKVKVKECTSLQKERKNLILPNLVFELKGLIYRSAQAQLAAIMLEIGDQLLLEEEADNENDASAVKVLTLSGEWIGYVDKEHCVLVGAMINRIDSCTIIKKSKHQIPFIMAEIKFRDKK